MSQSSDTGKIKNQWTHGKRTWQLAPLPAPLERAAGIMLMYTTLDPEVGAETVLVLQDPTPFIEELAAVRPFRLHMKSGLLRSRHGPVMFLVFWIPDPDAPAEPFFGCEYFVNTSEPNHLAPLQRLARQTHWHMVLVGAGNRVFDMFEFPNVYGLDKAVEIAMQIAVEEPCLDFLLAKQELMDKYSFSDLFRLGDQ